MRALERLSDTLRMKSTRTIYNDRWGGIASQVSCGELREQQALDSKREVMRRERCQAISNDAIAFGLVALLYVCLYAWIAT